MPLPTDSQKNAWRALFRVRAHARRHVDGALKQAGLPPQEVYDVLLELDRDSAGEGLTAKQLEQRLLLPQYGVSRLLDRMERQGLVARRPNPADRRSSLVSITGSGRALCAEIRQVYGRAIAEFFANRMRPGQVDRLGKLLAVLEHGCDDAPTER